MRKAARTDANQTAIVDALRTAGAIVSITSAVGQGFPDLCVGIGGRTLLFEVKDGTKYPSERRLTHEQSDWHKLWRGHVAIVASVDEALRELFGHV